MMKSSIKNTAILLFVICFLPMETLIASPYPWTITNAGENQDNFITDENNEYLSTFIIQLLEDSDGDGLSLPDDDGNPVDDDLLLTTLMYSTENLDIPDGSFVISTTLFSEVTPFNDPTVYYVRVFNESDIGQGSYYSESMAFSSPTSASNTQTEVIFNRLSNNYIGNLAPIIDEVADQEISAGEIFQFGLKAVDDDILTFTCIDYGFPGGEESLLITQTNADSASVEWTIPVTALGDYLMQFEVSDGQFADTSEFLITVTEVEEIPSAFHLISPLPDRTLFDGRFISWEEAISPIIEPVVYNFYWSLDQQFTSVDSIVNIDTTAIRFEFYQEESLPDRGNGINTIKQFEENEMFSNTSSLDEIIIFSPDLAEGTEIFWKVVAFHEGTSESRQSHEISNVYLEYPDSPSTPMTLEPSSGDTIRIVNPEFSWTEAFDADLGDFVSYDFIYTTDGYISLDTVKSVQDTTLSLQTDSNGSNNVSSLYETIWSTIQERITNSQPETRAQKSSTFTSRNDSQAGDISPIRENVSDDNSLIWWVEAVDTYPLRSSSDTSSIYIEIPEHPEEFVLVFPTDNQLFPGPRRVVFQWTPSFDPDPQQSVQYDLLISYDENIENPSEFEFVYSGITENRYTYDEIDEDDISLKWTVRAISGLDTIWANNDNSFYNTCSFSHPDKPSDFHLISPENMYIGSVPEFVWEASHDSDLLDSVSYSFVWTIDDWASWQRFDNLIDTTLQLDEFNDGDVIGWKVISYDTQGHQTRAVPSTGFSFVLNHDDPPIPFSLVEPDSGTVIAAPEIEFVWQSTVDPNGLEDIQYTIEVSHSPEFTDPYTEQILNDTTVTVSINDWSTGDYWWRVIAEDETSQLRQSSETWYLNVFATEAYEEAGLIPDVFEVKSLYPNPFNSSINVSLAVPSNSDVAFEVYDILGRKVHAKTMFYQIGYHTIPFDFNEQASGVYFIRIKWNNSIHSVHKVYLQK